MFKKKEITSILIATIILGFIISLVSSVESLIYAIIFIFIIIIINTTAKKISSYHFDSEIEIKLWEMKRYGYRAGQYLKKPFPIGAFLPIISVFLTLGYVKWMASLVFDIKPKIYRAAKRHSTYKFSEISESHTALIAASGILANLLFAIIGYMINFPEFARLNIYYAFFNLLPLSNLDGNKIFMEGTTSPVKNRPILWIVLFAMTLIGLLYVLLN